MHRTVFSDERRTARGPFKPTLYLVLEIILFAVLVFAAYRIGNNILLAAIAAFSVIFLFASSLPRYKKAIKRQETSRKLDELRKEAWLKNQ